MSAAHVRLKSHALYAPLAAVVKAAPPPTGSDVKSGKVESGTDSKARKASSWFTVEAPIKEPDNVVSTALLRLVGRAGFGNKPMHLELAIPVYGSSTVTTGVLLDTQLVDASLASEWSAPMALFEEYKVVSGRVEFMVTAFQTTSVPTTNGPNYLQVVYDPEVGTAIGSATGTTFLTHEQRKAFPLTLGGTSANSPVVTLPKLWKFPFKVPNGAMFSQRGATTANVGDVWCSTATPQPFGAVIMYAITTLITATPCLQGVMYLDVAFRNRF